MLLSVVLAAGACVDGGGQQTSGPKPPEEGEAAPPFELEAVGGSRMTLGDLTTSRPALFYFSMGPG
jgi:hypothetical protein